MRVSVLDSMILDSEMLRILEETLFSSINSFHVTRWTEEIKLVIKFFLWKFSVYENGSSIGQSLLGLKFNCNPKRKQLILFFILETMLPYIYSKLKRRLTEVNHLHWKWLDTVTKSAQFLNLCIFIKNGYYPSLAHRFTQLMLIRRSSQEIPSANYSSTQTRQLVWHYFADFLTIVLPIIKIHRIRSYISRLTGNGSTRKSASGLPRTLSLTTTTNSDNEADNNVVIIKCCYCKEDATIPIVIRNCRFCYYCFKANQGALALETQNDEEEVRRNLCSLHE